MSSSPTASRILIFGNSGSGKTTLAKRIAASEGIAHLDLDLLAWERPGIRKAVSESAAEIEAFVAQNRAWVIEGTYGDLIEIAIPHAAEIRFLNPGVEACVANCRARPWEPEKYATKAEQDAMLEFLLDWVRQYDQRTDEYSLARHRAIFDAFKGPKKMITEREA